MFGRLYTYAKKATEPVKPNTETKRGKVTVKIAAQNRFVATEILIPTSAQPSEQLYFDKGEHLAHTTMEKRECFGRIRERHWSFSWRIKCGKEENKEREDTQMGRTAFRYVEGKGRR